MPSPIRQVGNVYVQYREEEEAADALRNLSGRFYAGMIPFKHCWNQALQAFSEFYKCI